MSLQNYRPQQYSIREDLATAREQLVIALDRYADVCLTIRNTHHQDSQSAGFPWSEVVSELPFLPFLRERLQQATHNLNRAYELGQAKASPTYPPPIDKLPDEILVHIFWLVVAAQPRDLHSTGKYATAAFPSYPDRIAHTCVRWRRVASDCSPLWTHIYLASHPTRFSSILDRAESYVQRSGDLPVDLHIVGSEGHTNPSLDPRKDDINRFFASVAHRASSLEIVRNSPSISTIERESLAGILQGCSDTFTRLVVRSNGFPRYGFIGPFRESTGDWVMEGLTLEQIERGFVHLRVLHASQAFPRWTSTAYHGLVDLRLISQHKYVYECPTIKPAEFITILNASPRLRILYFGLNLFDPHSSTTGPSVRLHDLEVLHLSASGCRGPEDTEYEIQDIIRCITPGSKPLRLTLDMAVFYDPGPIETAKTFFSKSHIVKFCSKQGTPPPMQLIECAPHLTHLVFDRCRYDTLYDFNKARSQIIKLDSWVIRDSPVHIEDLELLLQQYSARSIVVSNCGLFSKEDAPVEIEEDRLGKWGFRFPNNIQYVNPDLSPDPTAGWGDLE